VTCGARCHGAGKQEELEMEIDLSDKLVLITLAGTPRQFRGATSLAGESRRESSGSVRSGSDDVGGRDRRKRALREATMTDKK
jgi:hypothetical protein